MKQQYLILYYITGIISLNTSAQFNIMSQRTVGGNSNDVLTCIYATMDKGLIAGGCSSSNISGEKTDTCRGGPDYWVIKFDSLARVEWDRTIGGKGRDILFLLQQTKDGGYILGGYSGSGISGEKTQKSKGSFDYWVVKLDRTGKIEWDRTIGGNGVEVLPCIQQTTDNGYILGGWSYSNILGDKTERSRGYEDYWVVKLDEHGNIQWDKTIGGTDRDGINFLEQTNDEGYIVGGYSSSNASNEKTQNSRGKKDYWIVKLDRSGNIKWDKTIGGNKLDMFYTLQETSDQGYILGGYSFSNKSGEKSENSRGKEDFWVVKLNKSGKIEWDKTIGGSGSDILNSLAQTKDGGYILGGESTSGRSGERTEDNLGGDDYWVIKLDASGRIEWDKAIGGSKGDVLYSIRQLSENVYGLGGFSSSEISGNKSQNSRGDNDYWIVTLKYKEPDMFSYLKK